MLLSQRQFPGDQLQEDEEPTVATNDFQKHIADANEFSSVVLIRNVPDVLITTPFFDRVLTNRRVLVESKIRDSSFGTRLFVPLVQIRSKYCIRPPFFACASNSSQDTSANSSLTRSVARVSAESRFVKALLRNVMAAFNSLTQKGSSAMWCPQSMGRCGPSGGHSTGSSVSKSVGASHKSVCPSISGLEGSDDLQLINGKPRSAHLITVGPLGVL